MATQIEALTAQLLAHGFDAKAGRLRIFLNGYGRDISASITLDYPHSDAAEHTGPMRLFSGCALKVYSNAEGEPILWLANRARQVKHQIMVRMAAAEIIPGPVCERWEDVIL